MKMQTCISRSRKDASDEVRVEPVYVAFIKDENEKRHKREGVVI